jgi:hypothetical protein
MSEPSIAIVVRGAEERTLKVCIERAQRGLGQRGAVRVVEARPFARALEESIEIAIATNQEYTLFLDGDILLKSGAVEEMILSARATKTRFYKIGFRILDWGFCGPTYGVHLYSTELLRPAREFVQAAYQHQRPETFLCKAMAKRGYPTLLQTHVVGLHDYEQYYRDIYRKSFVRACKFNKRVGYMLSRCIGRDSDPERRMMLYGLRDGLLYHATQDRAPLDIEFYRQRATAAMNETGLQEKGHLEDFTDEHIVAEISGFSPDDLYLQNVGWLSPKESVQWYGMRKGWFRRFRSGARRLLDGIEGFLEEVYG